MKEAVTLAVNGELEAGTWNPLSLFEEKKEIFVTFGGDKCEEVSHFSCNVFCRSSKNNTPRKQVPCWVIKAPGDDSYQNKRVVVKKCDYEMMYTIKSGGIILLLNLKTQRKGVILTYDYQEKIELDKILQKKVPKNQLLHPKSLKEAQCLSEKVYKRQNISVFDDIRLHLVHSPTPTSNIYENECEIKTIKITSTDDVILVTFVDPQYVSKGILLCRSTDTKFVYSIEMRGHLWKNKLDFSSLIEKNEQNNTVGNIFKAYTNSLFKC